MWNERHPVYMLISHWLLWKHLFTPNKCAWPTPTTIAPCTVRHRISQRPGCPCIYVCGSQFAQNVRTEGGWTAFSRWDGLDCTNKVQNILKVANIIWAYICVCIYDYNWTVLKDILACLFWIITAFPPVSLLMSCLFNACNYL